MFRNIIFILMNQYNNETFSEKINKSNPNWIQDTCSYLHSLNDLTDQDMVNVSCQLVWGMIMNDDLLQIQKIIKTKYKGSNMKAILEEVKEKIRTMQFAEDEKKVKAIFF